MQQQIVDIQAQIDYILSRCEMCNASFKKLLT